MSDEEREAMIHLRGLFREAVEERDRLRAENERLREVVALMTTKWHDCLLGIKS